MTCANDGNTDTDKQTHRDGQIHQYMQNLSDSSINVSICKIFQIVLKMYSTVKVRQIF